MTIKASSSFFVMDLKNAKTQRFLCPYFCLLACSWDTTENFGRSDMGGLYDSDLDFPAFI